MVTRDLGGLVHKIRYAACVGGRWGIKCAVTWRGGAVKRAVTLGAEGALPHHYATVEPDRNQGRSRNCSSNALTQPWNIFIRTSKTVAYQGGNGRISADCDKGEGVGNIENHRAIL